jgi:lathosterol oxidase
MLTEFAFLFLTAYAINLALYFGGGWLILLLNARHPERRIQAGRDGLRRAAVEIRESVISIAVTAACLAAALMMARHGLTLWPPPAFGALWAQGLWALAMLAVTTVLYDAWFYWMHRLLHTKRFWRFHRGHHKAVAPTVWSTDSQSVVETLLLQIFLVVSVALLPVPALTLVLHRLVDHINGQFGHAGFEYFAGPGARAPSPMLCAMFHDRHHERFTVNYANFFSLWDRWMGTLDPEYDRDVAVLERRREPCERA